MGNTPLQLQSSNMLLGPLVSPRIFGCECELYEAPDAGGYLVKKISFKLTLIGFKIQGFGWECWCDGIYQYLPPINFMPTHCISLKEKEKVVLQIFRKWSIPKQTHLQCINYEQSALAEDDGIIDGDCQVQHEIMCIKYRRLERMERGGRKTTVGR
eukprot:scaffold33672_cov153-Skeletonema_dohrnii-CCMP3373.AAC.9